MSVFDILHKTSYRDIMTSFRVECSWYPLRGVWCLPLHLSGERLYERSQAELQAACWVCAYRPIWLYAAWFRMGALPPNPCQRGDPFGNHFANARFRGICAFYRICSFTVYYINIYSLNDTSLYKCRKIGHFTILKVRIFSTIFYQNCKWAFLIFCTKVKSFDTLTPAPPAFAVTASCVCGTNFVRSVRCRSHRAEELQAARTWCRLVYFDFARLDF